MEEKNEVMEEALESNITLGDSEEPNEKPKEDELVFTFVKLGKWGKKQDVSIFDFSSLDGTIHAVALMAAVFGMVHFLKKKRK